jgi:hypothetical protein
MMAPYYGSTLIFHPNYGEFNNQRRDKFRIYTRAAYDFISKTHKWNRKNS